MRHHRRAQDADREVQPRRIGDEAGVRREPRQHRLRIGARQQQLDTEARRDGGDQHDHECLQPPEAAPLEREDQQHVERGHEDSGDQRQPEQQLEPDRGADHLGQVAGDNGDLAQQPQRQRDRAGVGVAARGGEVAAGGAAQPRGQRLEHDRHDVGGEHDEQEVVAERRAAGEVGRPVARVHIADRDHVARPGERGEAAPARPGPWHRHRPEHAGQAWSALRPPGRACCDGLAAHGRRCCGRGGRAQPFTDAGGSSPQFDLGATRS